MSDAQGLSGTPMSFGKGARDLSHLPNLAPDLCRSYQWPFHIRIHPDEWEVVGEKWRLCVERIGLRPGVAGVGGKPGDLNSLTDLPLLQDWSKVGDRKWVVLASGDHRLRDVFEDGNFLRSVKVASQGREGTVIIACWERVTEDGQIVNDDAVLHDYSVKLAKAIFELRGPTRAAERKVAQKLAKLRNQLLSSAGASRVQGGSHQLKKRILRVSKMLVFITRDESYMEGIDLMESEKDEAKKGKPSKAKPAKDEASAPDSALAALIAKFGGADKLLAALASAEAAKVKEAEKGEEVANG